MGLEQRLEQHYREVVDKYVEPTTTYQMSTRDYVVRPYATSAFTITLPNVADAAGRIYTILARNASGANVVTIAHKGDSEGWSNVLLNNTGEKCVLYSDGVAWFVLMSLI
jgi:hypothetical protein